VPENALLTALGNKTHVLVVVVSHR